MDNFNSRIESYERNQRFATFVGQTVALAVILGFLLVLATGCGTGATGPEGAPGKTGPAGINGGNGQSALQPLILAADSVHCPTGGYELVADPSFVSAVQNQDGTRTYTYNDAVYVCNGAQGLQGDPGQPGTIITEEQFCPGYTSSYPSTFPEVGLLIDGKLFGVYSTNGQAALTEIPAGTYSSTSPSAPCTFMVNADGSISN